MLLNVILKILSKCLCFFLTHSSLRNMPGGLCCVHAVEKNSLWGTGIQQVSAQRHG